MLRGVLKAGMVPLGPGSKEEEWDCSGRKSQS